MADDKKINDKEIELIVEQVLTKFKGLVLTPAPRRNRVEEHIIIINDDEYENNGIETEIAIIELNDRLMNLPWRTHDNIPMQIISLLHEAHVALNVNAERLMERLTRDRVVVPCSQTQESVPILSCTLCFHMLQLLYQHVFNSNGPHRAVNLPVLPCPQYEPTEGSTSRRSDGAQAGYGNEPRPSTSRSRGRPSLEVMAYCRRQEQIDMYASRRSGLFHEAPADNNHNAVDFNEPQPSTSRWSEYSHAAQFHDQHVNPNAPHRAFDTHVSHYRHHELMEASTSHRGDQPHCEADSEMPSAKNAKYDESLTSELDFPSDYADSCVDTSDTDDEFFFKRGNDNDDNAMAEVQEARRKKFQRIKKTQQLNRRKFKK